MRKIFCALIIAGLLLTTLASCSGSALPFKDEQGNVSFDGFTIEATDCAPYGTAPDSAFRLTAPGDYSAAQVKKMLSAEPEAALSVEKEESGSFLIKMEGERPLGSSLTLTLSGVETEAAPRSFVFKMMKEFALNSVFPEDGSFGVAQRSSVELIFSAPVKDISQLFTIEPATPGSFTYVNNRAIFRPDDVFQLNTKYTVTLKAGAAGVYGSATAEGCSFSFTVGESYDGGAPFELVSRGNVYDEKAIFETFLPDEYPMIDVRNVSYQGGKGGEADAAGSAAEVEFGVTIHSLASVNDYLYYLHEYRSLLFNDYRNKLRVDTEQLDKVIDFTQKVDFSSEFAQANYYSYISLPEKLPEGWYVATVKAPYPDGSGRTLTMQKLIQVSAFTYFQQTYNGEALLWINNGITGEAVANAEFELYSNPNSLVAQGKAKTDESGLAVFELPPPPADAPRQTFEGDKTPLTDRQLAQDYAFYYAVKTEDGILGYVATSSPDKERSFVQKYYSYLYTDRSVYKQSDTVEFWGMVNPRGEEFPALEQMEITMVNDYEGGEISRQTVPVEKDGTFKGKVSYKDIASGGYNIYAHPVGLTEEQRNSYDSRVYASISVYQYKKPDYTHSAEFDKEYYNYDDTINVKFAMSFFDGTPRSGIEMHYSDFVSAESYGNNSEEQNLTTDANGEIKKQIVLPEYMQNNSVNSWRPMNFGMHFNSASAEDSYFSVDDTVPFFPSDTMLQLSSKAEKGKATLDISANKIELSGLKHFEDWRANDCAAIKGEGLQRDVKVEVWHCYTTKTQNGTYYDPYTKTSVPAYDYVWNEVSFANFNRRTEADGSLQMTGLPVCGEQDTYYAVVTMLDGLGHELTEKIYLGDMLRPRLAGKGNMPGGQGKSYTVFAKGSVSENIDEGYYWFNSVRFDADKDIEIELYENEKPFKIPEGGRWMFDILQDKVTATAQQASSTATIKSDDKFLPDFMLCGAYFDGRRIYGVQSRSFEVNPESRELDLQLETNRESFLPGESLEATVKVLDKDGAVQKNAAVCVGVANEAVFAVEEQWMMFAQNMYNSCFNPYPILSVSFVDRMVSANPDSGGKGGGGGGSGGLSVRADFKDSVGIQTAVTDGNGEAKFTFKLPDDLTSWRITALALSDNLKAGNSKSNVVSTLPFFVRPIMNSYALVGDNVTIMLRGFGASVKDGEKIEYSVSVDGGAAEKAEGQAGGYTPIALGKTLAEGEHKVTVKARCAGYEDAIEQKFTVVETAMETKMIDWFELGKDEVELEVKKSPVIVTLTNSDYEPFLKATGIIMNSSAERNDEKLARPLIGKVLGDFYGGTSMLPPEYMDPVNASIFGNGGKGEEMMAKLFPYAEPDAIFTGRAAVAAAESVREAGWEWSIYDQINSYLAGESNHNSTEAAALMMGAAAVCRENQYEDALIGEKTIREALDVMMERGDMTTRGRIYLITALSYFDKEAAANLFNKEITPMLKTEGDYKFIPAEGEERAVSITAAALLAAVKTGEEADAAAMVGYIAEKQQSIFTRGDAVLEAAIYANSFVPKRTGAPVVSYKLDGKTVKADLDKAKAVRITMTKEQFAAADFKLESGSATAQVEYVGNPDDGGFEKSPDITLTRELIKEKEGLGGTTAIVYTATFGAGAEYGYYKITDWVPSVLRAKKEASWNKEIFAAYGGESYWSEFDMENQLFSGYFNYNEQTGRTIKIVLHAQNVLEGECVLDDAYLFNTETMKGTYIDGGGSFAWK